MKPHAAIILLLIFCLCATPFTAARPHLAQEDASERLTPEEEREARTVAIRFVRRFQETLDVAALVNSEMFVSDLPQRIRKHPSNESFYKPAEDGVVEQVSDGDLRRCFAAFTNALFLHWALTETDKFRKRNIEQQEDCGEETPVEKLLPPEVIHTLTSDSTFGSAIAREMREDEGSGQERGDEDDAFKINSPERLRNLVSLIENAAAITRKHLNNLPAWEQVRRHVPFFNPNLRPDEGEAVSLEVTNISEDLLGVREGEEVICARVLMFHFDLVKLNGRLKILAVSDNDYRVRTSEETEKAAKLATLLAAIENGDTETVESMLMTGVSVNERDDDCKTPVLHAAMSKRLEMVKLLIDWGANVNTPNGHGNSALLYAAANGDVEMTRALLDAGADVNAPDGAGCSPLCFALRYSLSESHRKVVELLKSRGAAK